MMVGRILTCRQTGAGYILMCRQQKVDCLTGYSLNKGDLKA